MDWVVVTGTMVAMGIPVGLLFALFTHRSRKLEAGDAIARRLVGELAAGLGSDERVTISARVSRAENPSFVNQGRGPLYARIRVEVDLQGLSVPFRLRRHGAVALEGAKKAVGLLHDVELGDEAFDEDWIVEADPAFARAVLTPEVRGWLRRLAAGLPDLAAIEVGASGLSMEWGGLDLGTDTFWGLRGLDPHWNTADPRATLAAARDTLLDLRARILAHVEAEALAGIEGGSYRRVEPLRVEAPPAETQEEVVEVEATRRRA